MIKLTKTTPVNVGTFNNSYSAAETNVVFEATKHLTGRDLVDGEFEFNLYNNDTNTLIQTKTNDADGNVVFDAITFDIGGAYNYKIYENEVDQNGVTVDTTSYEITVFVYDNGKGNLETEIYVDTNKLSGAMKDVVVFENKYKADATDIVIKAKKVLDGRDLVADEFEFQLYLGDDLLQTVKNDADGNVVFNNILVESAGKVTFIVKEVKGDAEGITYDETVYTITATVTDNLDGTLSVDYLYEVDGDKVDEIVFNNKYTDPTPETTPESEPQPEPTPNPQPESTPTSQPESPKTGDITNLSAWLAVVFVSGAIIFATGKKLKRLKKS